MVPISSSKGFDIAAAEIDDVIVNPKTLQRIERSLVAGKPVTLGGGTSNPTDFDRNGRGS